MSFRKVSTGKADGEFLCIKCNPMLDVIASLYSTGDVVLHRFLNWKHLATLKPLNTLKLHSTKPEENVITFEWSPNGKYIAVVYNGYFTFDKNSYPNNLGKPLKTTDVQESNTQYLSSIAIFDIHTSAQVLSQNCCERVACFHWNSCHTSTNLLTNLPEDCINTPYVNLFSNEQDFFNFIGYEYTKPVEPLEAKNNVNAKFKAMLAKNENTAELELAKFERNVFYENQTLNNDLNIQVTVSRNGLLNFYVYGLYKILTLKFQDLLLQADGGIDIDKSAEYVVENVWNLANCDSFVMFFSRVDSGQHFIGSISLSFLEKRANELFAFIKLMFQLDLRIEFLDRNLVRMANVWEDLCSSINRMLSNYLPTKDEKEEENLIDIYSRKRRFKLEAQDFMDMLVLGDIAPNMEKFLVDMTEMEFKKLGVNIEIYFVRMLRLNLDELQSTLFHILCYLNVLKAMSLEKTRFADLCLSVVDMNQFVRNTHAMLIKSTQMQVSICDSMKKIRSFLRWLSKCSAMYSKDNSDSDSRNDITPEDSSLFLTTTGLNNSDLQLVMEFLQENSLTSSFKFPDVEFYFNKAVSSFEEAFTKNISRLAENPTQSESRPPYKQYLNMKHKESFFDFIQNLYQKENEQKDATILETTVEKSDSLADCFSTTEKFNDESMMDAADLTNETFKESSSQDTFDPVLDFEENEEWEHDLFNDSDDVDKFDESVYAEFSLHQHLVILHQNFVDSFKKQTNAKFSRLQTQLFEKKIDQFLVYDIDPKFLMARTEQFFDESRSCLMLANCVDDRSIRLFEKPADSNHFSAFIMDFHYNSETHQKNVLWVRDFKFFDGETLSLLLSEFDPETSAKHPQEVTEEYEDENILKNRKEESGHFLVRLKFPQIYLAEFGEESMSGHVPNIDICLDSQISRKWLQDIEDEKFGECIELRELSKGTPTTLYTSRARNIIAVVGDSGRRVSVYDVDDTEESEE